MLHTDQRAALREWCGLSRCGRLYHIRSPSEGPHPWPLSITMERGTMWHDRVDHAVSSLRVCSMSGDPSSVLGRNAISLWAENVCVASRGSSINGILQGFHQKWAMWQNIDSQTPVIAANSPLRAIACLYVTKTVP